MICESVIAALFAVLFLQFLIKLHHQNYYDDEKNS